MKRKDVQQIMQNTDEAYAKLYNTIIPDATRARSRLALQMWKKSLMRRKIEIGLLKAPETPERMNALDRSKSVDVVVEALQHEFRRAVKKIPTGHPGRQPRFSEEEKRKICGQIEGLYRTNSIKESVATVAALYRVSTRTILRVWKDRSKYLQPPAPAIGFIRKT
jgi:hypothetical protein